jgi:predicted DNA-binding ribbon-helix-helix protein
MEAVGPVAKRSISIHGHKTSVSLEEEFWKGLKALATSREIPIWKLAQQIHDARGSANFSSAIRVYVLRHFSQQE